MNKELTTREIVALLELISANTSTGKIALFSAYSKLLSNLIEKEEWSA